MGLYKKCEECGTDINKLQHWFNIYLLKTGIKLKCPNCGAEYKTNKFISFMGNLYTYSGISIFVLIICIPIFWDIFEKIFKKNFDGIEMLFYTFIILSIVDFMVMVVLPLNKVENKKEGE